MKSKIVRSSDPIAESVDDELVMADIDAASITASIISDGNLAESGNKNQRRGTMQTVM